MCHRHRPDRPKLSPGLDNPYASESAPLPLQEACNIVLEADQTQHVEIDGTAATLVASPTNAPQSIKDAPCPTQDYPGPEDNLASTSLLTRDTGSDPVLPQSAPLMGVYPHAAPSLPLETGVEVSEYDMMVNHL